MIERGLQRRWELQLPILLEEGRERAMTDKRTLLLAGGIAAALLALAGQASANDEIEKRAKDPNQWGAPGRDNQLTRHSPLKDINTGNVDKLLKQPAKAA